MMRKNTPPFPPAPRSKTTDRWRNRLNHLGSFTLLCTCFFLLLLKANATNYYFDADSGNDSASGTSAADPFQSLDKLNSLQLNAGDKVLFKRGSTWYGSVTMDNACVGTTANPITFGDYGSGARPAFRGLLPVGTGNWILHDNPKMIYRLNLSSFTPPGSAPVSVSKVSHLLQDDSKQNLCRDPNPGNANPVDDYHWISQVDSPSSKTQAHTSLTRPDDWYNDAKFIVRNMMWTSEGRTVASFTQSTGIITFASSLRYTIKANHGFYFEGSYKLIDQDGEWWFKEANQTLYYKVPTGSSLTDVKIAYLDKGFAFSGNDAHIKMENLNIGYYNSNCISASNVPGLIVKDCILRDTKGSALSISATNHAEGYGNRMQDSRNGMYLAGSSNLSIYDNEVTRMTNDGIFLQECSDSVVEFNKTYDTGRNGITVNSPTGNNIYIVNNLIEKACTETSDNGGFYAASPLKSEVPNPGGSQPIWNYFQSNLVLNTEGNMLTYDKNTMVNGNRKIRAVGIYLDHDAQYWKILDNFVVNETTVPRGIEFGIKLNFARYNNIKRNVVYGADASAIKMMNPVGTAGWWYEDFGNLDALVDNKISSNVFYMRHINDKRLAVMSEVWKNTPEDYDARSEGDWNTFVDPFSPNVRHVRDSSSSPTQYTTDTLSQWRSLSGFDLVSTHNRNIPTDYSVVPSSVDVFDNSFVLVNDNLYSNMTFPLTGSYVDAYGDPITTSSVTLAPLTAKIVVPVP